MRSVRRACLTLLCLSALTGGCGNPRAEFSILGRLFGPGGPEMVEMILDVEDADRRREGITLLSEKDWGLRDPYLKYFALTLRGAVRDRAFVDFHGVPQGVVGRWLDTPVPARGPGISVEAAAAVPFGVADGEVRLGVEGDEEAGFEYRHELAVPAPHGEIVPECCLLSVEQRA